MPPASVHSCARLIMLRCTRRNIVILMAATVWLMLSFSSCIVCGFHSYTVLFKCPQKKFLRPPPTHTHDTGTEGHQPRSCSMLHRVYLNMVTARLFRHYAMYAYILTPERISQGHVQNGRRATFSWPAVYICIIKCNS